MLDRVSKILTIIAATVAIVVIFIGGVAWAIRLDADVLIVQGEVAELRQEVGGLRQEVTELRRDMDEVKENQQRLEENQRLILQALEGLQAAIANHTHDADGRAQIPLASQ
ncbi:MAG: hypothetical protein OXL37_00155 [Chloroflexota bacterium]|nr:hypothetical protein [Chloroflexota bacterium]MDE2959743.1 hypothetical protein [Chloroflexota bacterium]